LVNKEQCHHTGEVYYDLAMDNYYCADCSKGMGVQYYRLAEKYEALEKLSMIETKSLYAVGDYLVRRFRDIPSLKKYVGSDATEENALEIIVETLKTVPEGYEFFQFMNFTLGATFVVYRKIKNSPHSV